MELFNDGGYLRQTASSLSLQRMLATVGFTGTNGMQSHPPTQNNSKQAATHIHDLQNAPDHIICRRNDQGKVGF